MNGVAFSEMDEAPPRERAALARSAISFSLDGPKKSAKFGLLRRGEYIGVSILFNTHTKFGKLSVGKYVVTAKQRNSGDLIFPLTIALSGLHPLSKVWVNYEPLPKNTFVIKVNDADVYSLVKEEVDYDPSKTEELNVQLYINEKENNIIDASIPWIIDEVADKIEKALGMGCLTSLKINCLKCKS